MKPAPITHLDLFAGPGGICTGFKAAGIKTLAAVEYITTCCDTYSANHPEVAVMCLDVRKVTGKMVFDRIEASGGQVQQGSIDVVSAGFPCETFSTAGSKSRVYGDRRNYLYKEAIRLADEVRAKLLVLENVPAFLSKRVSAESRQLIFDLLIKDLEKAGFIHHSYAILNAADHGVPQSRQRFIMLASKTIPVDGKMLSDGGKRPGVTVGEALSDLPPIGPEQEATEYASEPMNAYQETMRSPRFWGVKSGINQTAVSGLTYHKTPKHRPGTIERLKMLQPGESLKDLFDKCDPQEVASLQARKILPKKWFIQRNYRLIAAGISRTVTSHCLDELVHPQLNRALSVREAARLQSFPDWYDFKGGPFICPHMFKIQDKYEQIGDAVPPLLAFHIGSRISLILKKYADATKPRVRQRVLSGSLR